VAIAKKGSDDPTGHVRESGGADDQPADARHVRGRDDGANHR
jgi:hypothetical protein